MLCILSHRHHLASAHARWLWVLIFLMSFNQCDRDTVLDHGRSVTDHPPSPTFLWEIREQPSNKHINGKPNSFLYQEVFSVKMKVQSNYLPVGLKRNMEISSEDRFCTEIQFQDL